MKKIALITGSAKRIGREIALHLARKGWKIIIHCNNSIKEADELSKQIIQISDSYVIQQNLTKIKSLNSIFLKAKENIGTPTLLINNASMFVRDQEQISEESLSSHMNINCFAPILLSQEFAALNSKDKTIINIIDFFSNTPTKDYMSYNLSKTALMYATKCLALKFPDCRINSISPGMTLEPESQKEKEVFRRLIQTTHKSKKTSISDILNAIDLLLNKHSTSGHNIILTDKDKHYLT